MNRGKHQNEHRFTFFETTIVHKALTLTIAIVGVDETASKRISFGKELGVAVLRRQKHVTGGFLHRDVFVVATMAIHIKFRLTLRIVIGRRHRFKMIVVAKVGKQIHFFIMEQNTKDIGHAQLIHVNGGLLLPLFGFLGRRTTLGF